MTIRDRSGAIACSNNLSNVGLFNTIGSSCKHIAEVGRALAHRHGSDRGCSTYTACTRMTSTAVRFALYTLFSPLCSTNLSLSSKRSACFPGPDWGWRIGPTGTDGIVLQRKLECGPMPNVTAAKPNIGGALCESSVIPFPVPGHKVWLTAAARLPCSNAANVGERKTWT